MQPLNPKGAVVLLSGGQDSTTCLYLAKQKFEVVHALTINYGQRHAREIAAASRVAAMAAVQAHKLLHVQDVLSGASPLTNPARGLEQYADFDAMVAQVGDRTEATYVPVRNALFAVLAANYAAANGLGAVVLGVCENDTANYPDCTAQFVASMEQTLNLGLGLTPPPSPHALRLWAPLGTRTKAEAIWIAMQLPGCLAALSRSHTAYDGQYPPTGHDHASLLRAEAFRQAGVPDPLVVRAVLEGAMPLPETGNYREYHGPKGVQALVELAAQWGITLGDDV